jgi:hypothetical protein
MASQADEDSDDSSARFTRKKTSSECNKERHWSNGGVEKAEYDNVIKTSSIVLFNWICTDDNAPVAMLREKQKKRTNPEQGKMRGGCI